MIGALVKYKETGNIGVVVKASLARGDGVFLLVQFGKALSWIKYTDLEVIE